VSRADGQRVPTPLAVGAVLDVRAPAILPVARSPTTRTQTVEKTSRCCSSSSRPPSRARSSGDGLLRRFTKRSSSKSSGCPPAPTFAPVRCPERDRRGQARWLKAVCVCSESPLGHHCDVLNSDAPRGHHVLHTPRPRPQCRRPRSWYGLVDERTVRGRSPGSRVTEVSRSWTRVKVSFDTRAGCARSVLVATRSGPLFRNTVAVPAATSIGSSSRSTRCQRPMSEEAGGTFEPEEDPEAGD
jgi:hypothetical protein